VKVNEESAKVSPAAARTISEEYQSAVRELNVAVATATICGPGAAPLDRGLTRALGQPLPAVLTVGLVPADREFGHAVDRHGRIEAQLFHGNREP
jgi:hypothetical protein